MLGSEAQPPDELACPLLGLAGDSRTHFRFPSGEHRCYAVVPPITLTPSYQARYCLSPEYPTCERYKAWQARPSRAAPVASLASVRQQPGPDPNLRRSATVRSGRLAGVPVLPIVIVVVLILALTAFVMPGWLLSAGTAGPTPAASAPIAAGSPSPTPTDPLATPTPAFTLGGTPTLSPSPTTSSQPTPSPTYRHTIKYVVRPGDTLKELAAKYGVTVQSIVDANKLSDPNLILSGQTLLIPQP